MNVGVLVTAVGCVRFLLRVSRVGQVLMLMRLLLHIDIDLVIDA